MAGEIVPVLIDVIRAMNDIGLINGLSVEDEFLVDEPHPVTGNADDPLDECLREIHRITENDDIAALDILVRE